MERTHQSVELVDSLLLCTYTVPKSRRHCRQSVAKPGGLLCATRAKQLALSAPPADPLAEIAAGLGDLSEISEVSQFLAKILKLACQNRISISRATALTFIANSLLNSLRLLMPKIASPPKNLLSSASIGQACLAPSATWPASARNSLSRIPPTPLSLHDSISE